MYALLLNERSRLVLQVERYQGSGDDTSLNGVRLLCQSGTLPYQKTHVESSTGPWGEWTPYRSCSVGRLKAFQLRVEGHQGGGDDTAANNVRFRCSFGQVLEGDGMGWGSWGQWSEECGQGVCGIQTRLESSQGNGDDTALNDMVLLCC
uniref:Uncharacterized protein n=1 Tax=Denticeps clupeoides TaxID=299321 RepID=A0AAY4CAM7_9TELE